MPLLQAAESHAENFRLSSLSSPETRSLKPETMKIAPTGGCRQVQPETQTLSFTQQPKTKTAPALRTPFVQQICD